MEQVKLELLHKEVIAETLEAHIWKLLNTDADPDQLSSKLLTLKSFMSPIGTFVRRRTEFIIWTVVVHLRLGLKNTWQSWEHMVTLSKDHQADHTWEARKTTTAGLPDADRKIVVQA